MHVALFLVRGGEEDVIWSRFLLGEYFHTLFSVPLIFPRLRYLTCLEEDDETKICALHRLVLKYDDFRSKAPDIGISNTPRSKPLVGSQLGIPGLKLSLSFQSVIMRIFWHFQCSDKCLINLSRSGPFFENNGPWPFLHGPRCPPSVTASRPKGWYYQSGPYAWLINKINVSCLLLSRLLHTVSL